MSNPAALRHVYNASDSVEADAIRQALSEAGIEVEVVCSGEMQAMELFVSADDHPKAEAIIRCGHWPRLA